ncbi:MAG: HAD family phosphatase [Actinomyces urogenitalis]|uniref:HAD family hydrolase n=1 Tax=Actinomyces urogenitalis TaxID=103621 RepID=UPI002A841CC0|nr:HAD family phosphatase [Actinomyces urogenitalis]MDY3677640.1 HAD family phosphatase [Actinomyces urogenitalis]
MTSPHTAPASTPRAIPDQVQAVLFDMDDTLVDSERAWAAAADRLWAETGSSSRAPAIPGGTIEDLARAYGAGHPSADLEAVTARLLVLLDEELGDQVRPMPGAVDLVSRLDTRLPVAVASNSPSAVVRRTITTLGWSKRFSAMLGTDDVPRPKPAPDLYHEAARRCGAEIEHCVVFEDSPMGAKAALSSGAFVITLGSTDTGHLSVPDLLDPLVTSWNPEPLS